MTYASTLAALSPIASWRLGEASLAGPTFLGQTTVTPSTVTSFTITPVSQAAGTCVIVAGTTGVNSTTAAPAGWTTVLSLDVSASGASSTALVFYRIIQPGDATTWTFSGTTDGSAAFCCTTYDHVGVVEVTATNSDNAGSAATSWAGPTVTAGAVGPYRFVHCVSTAFATGATNSTLDAALTSRSTAGVTFFGARIGDEVISSSGTTTARTTTSTQSQTWAEAVLLLAGTAVDSSGNGHTGTYVGTPTLGTTGLLTGDSDTAVTLGASKYVTTAVSTAYNITHPAVVAWVKASGYGDFQQAVSQSDATTSEHWYLCFRSSGRAQFTVVDGVGANNAISSAFVDNSTRHMIVGRYDGAFLDLWIDGVRDVHTAYTGTMNIAAGIPLTIGAKSDGSLTGTVVIDEVAYLDASNLTDTAIGNLWTAGTTAGRAVIGNSAIGLSTSLTSGSVRPGPPADSQQRLGRLTHANAVASRANFF